MEMIFSAEMFPALAGFVAGCALYAVALYTKKHAHDPRD